MWFAIISSLTCFAVATVIFTKSSHDVVFYCPLSFYFLFEGTWVLLDFIFKRLCSESLLTSNINYIGTSIFMITLLCFFYKDKDKEKASVEQTSSEDDTFHDDCLCKCETVTTDE